MTFPDKNSGCRHSLCCDNNFFSYTFVFVRTTWVGGSWMRVWRVWGQSKGTSMVQNVLLTATEGTCMVQFGFLATTMGACMEQDVLLTATEGVSIV